MMKEILPNSFIYVVDNAFSKDLCKKIITTFEKDKKAQHPGHTMSGHHPDIKLTYDLGIDPTNKRWVEIDKIIYSDLHQVLEKIINKFSALKEMNLMDTGYNIQRYSKNTGRYVYHMDESGGSNGRFRQFSVVIYLNDVEQGGETEFKYFGIKVKPKAGRVVVFPPYWMYLHRGCKPTSDDKYIISTFIQSKQEA